MSGAKTPNPPFEQTADRIRRWRRAGGPPLINSAVWRNRRNGMHSLVVLYTTAALMAVVAVACTALCLAWSIPAWRRRLARRGVACEIRGGEAGGLTGWPARLGGGLVSIGIASCAVVAWYGCYCVLAALSAVPR